MRFTITLVVLGLLAGGLLKASEESIDLKKLPPGVLEATKKAFPGAEVVGAAHSTEEAIAVAGRVQPDVVITDMMRFSGLEGGPAIEIFLKIWPHTHVLVITAGESKSAEREAVEAGAIGYLSKQAEEDEICEAIQRVARGLPAPPNLHVETSSLDRMRQTSAHTT